MKMVVNSYAVTDGISPEVEEPKPLEPQAEMEKTIQCCQPISITELWKEYMSDTSLHGCKNILRRRIWTRYLWIVSVIGMGTALGFTLVSVFLRYKEHPFKTVWNIQQETKTIMPTFTFCLPSDLDMERLSQSPLLFDYISKTRSPFGIQHFFGSMEEAEKYLAITKELLSNISLSEFRDMSKFRTEDIFFSLHFNEGISYKGQELKAWIHETFDQFRSCWILNGRHQNSTQNKKVSMFDSIRLFIDLKSHRFSPDSFASGMKIYAHEHHKNHIFFKPIHLKPGSFAEIFFSRTEHHYLPTPYHSFGGQNCVYEQHDKLKNPLGIWSKYSRNSCILEHAIIKTAKDCKCADPDFKSFFPNISECSVVEYENCVFFKLHKNIESIVLEDGAQTIGCLSECRFTSYDLSVSSANFPNNNSLPFFQLSNLTTNLEYARENLVYVSIQAKDETVNVIKHVPEVTPLYIFGTVGGYMGLLLGASVLSLTEFVETLLLSLWLLISQLIFKIKELTFPQKIERPL